MTYWRQKRVKLGRRTFVRGAAAGGLGLAGAVLIGCGESEDNPGSSSTATGTSSTPSAAQSGGHMVVSGLEARATFDPHSDGQAHPLQAPVVEQLYALKALSGQQFPGHMEPKLAESAEVSDDFMTWVFKLRPGVVFHDGNPFTAEDVIRTVARTTSDESSPLYNPTRANFGARSYRSVESVEAVDELTVRFNLNTPDNAFIGTLADVRTSGILSAESLEQLGDASAESHPVSTGPFKWVEWVRDDRVELERHGEYWGKQAPLERLTYKFINDDNSRLQALVTGEIDVDLAVGVGNRSIVDDNPALSIVTFDCRSHDMLMLDTRNTFPDVRVRRAISLAIDRPTYNREVLNGKVVESHSIYPSGSMFYQKDHWPEIPFDLTEARRLVDAAGFAPVDITMTSVEQSSATGIRHDLLAQSLQDAFRTLGINFTLRVMPQSEMNQLSAKGLNVGVNEILLTATPTRSVTDMTNKYWSGSQPPNGQNRMWYVNPRVDELLELAKSSPLEEVAGHMHELEDIVMEDIPLITMFEGRPLAGRGPNVGGLPDAISADESIAWNDVFLNA